MMVISEVISLLRLAENAQHIVTFKARARSSAASFGMKKRPGGGALKCLAKFISSVNDVGGMHIEIGAAEVV